MTTDETPLDEQSIRELTAENEALTERVRELEAQAKLYDQECGMCGSSAAELVAYAEWRDTDNAKLGAELARARDIIERAHKSLFPFAVSLCRDMADFLAPAPSTEPEKG